MHDRLQTALRELRLSEPAQSLDVRLQEAQGHALNHAEFLELILQDELLVRQERQIERRVKSATFRELKALDDFDWSFNPSKRSGEYLFEIIMRRYETRSTVMTSNRPLEDWGKLIGDVPSATAILDRFLHHAEVVSITGRSYRLRNQAAAAEQTSAATREIPPGDSNPAISPAGNSPRKKRPAAPEKSTESSSQSPETT